MGNEGERPENLGRRRFLTATTSVVGAVGAGYLAVPFIKSWNPSARAKLAGAPMTQDISALAEGQQLTLKWRGQPVYVEVTFRAERDEAGLVRELHAVGRDMTDRRRVEQAWAHRALHDPLTGLPNRALLLDHLGLAEASRAVEDAVVADLAARDGAAPRRTSEVGDAIAARVSP